MQNKINILVSECLIGIDCNYKGTNKRSEKVLSLMEWANLIPICPEQLGGMTTPRPPSENNGNKVFSVNGEDVTDNYNRGAEMSLRLANIYGCKYAVLKSRSPSCGYGKVYDGTFTGTLVDGNGTTAGLLSENGIRIFSEESVDLLIDLISKQ